MVKSNRESGSGCSDIMVIAMAYLSSGKTVRFGLGIEKLLNTKVGFLQCREDVMKEADKYLIRKVYQAELDEAFTLIWNVFQQFVSPDYTKEGIDYFYDKFVAGQSFRDQFLNDLQTMYGVFDDSRVVGVLSISKDDHVSCVFVDGNYQRKGIATKLFSEVISELKQRGTEKIRLNASPYGVPFYHAIGFTDTDTEKVYHGIRYTPMELRL